MENEQKTESNKKKLLIVMTCILIATVLTHWYLNSIAVDEITKLNQQQEQTKAKAREDSIALQRYTDTITVLLDTIEYYKTRAGLLTAEIDLKKAEIKQTIARYNVAKLAMDTAKIMRECDSLIANQVPRYLILDKEHSGNTDSVISVQNTVIDKCGKELTSQLSVNSGLVQQLLDCQKSNAVLVAEKKETKDIKKANRKDKLFAGLIGGVITFVAMLFGN